MLVLVLYLFPSPKGVERKVVVTVVISCCLCTELCLMRMELISALCRWSCCAGELDSHDDLQKNCSVQVHDSLGVSHILEELSLSTEVLSQLFSNPWLFLKIPTKRKWPPQLMHLVFLSWFEERKLQYRAI